MKGRKEMFNKEKKIEKIIEWGREKRTNKIVKLASHKDPEIRIAVAKACKHLRNGEGYLVLTNLVRDEEVAVKKEAIISLGKFGRTEAISHLLHIKESETDEEIKAVCQEAVDELHRGARE